jgi:hypothetical protein
VTIDQVHVGFTALLWLVGFVLIVATTPKVSPIRRGSYIIAIPLWAGWTALYTMVFFTGDFPEGRQLGFTEMILRVLLFGIALEGVLVPIIDRLEMRPPKVILTVEDE